MHLGFDFIMIDELIHTNVVVHHATTRINTKQLLVQCCYVRHVQFTGNTTFQIAMLANPPPRKEHGVAHCATLVHRTVAV